MAAVVSDNDGSAFITKSEFDSLKNDFQSQLDRYNTSIDSKIDTAIASYLSGLNIQAKVTKTIINSDWKIVSMVDNYDKNVYQYPDINLYYSALWQGDDSTDFSEHWKATAWWWASLNYTRSTSSTDSARLICDAGTESSTKPEYIVWLGKSKDLQEKIVATLLQIKDNANTMATGYLTDSNAANTKLKLINSLYFVNGYYPQAFVDASALWKPGTWYTPQWHSGDWWKTSGGSGSGYISTTVPYSSASFEIALLNENNTELVDSHILTYSNFNFDEFTDVDWNHTLYRGTTNTLTEENFMSAITKNGTLRISENGFDKSTGLPNGDNAGAGRFTGRNFDAYHAGNDTSAYKCISVGLLNKTYDGEHILQTGKSQSIVDGKKIYTIPNDLNLINGLPVMYGDKSKNGHIKWKPTFKTYNNGVAADYEVCIWLVQDGKFASGTSVELGAKTCMNKDLTYDWLITTDKTCTFDFDVPGDGIIYAKWWPANDTIKNNKSHMALAVSNAIFILSYTFGFVFVPVILIICPFSIFCLPNVFLSILQSKVVPFLSEYNFNFGEYFVSISTAAAIPLYSSP